MRAQGHLPRVRFGAIAAAAIAIASIGHAAQSPTVDLDVTDRVVVASKIYSLVQQYFAHWEGAPRATVDAAYREYLDRVVREKERKEFDLATLRFIATLRNGHTQFLDGAMDGRPLKFRLLQVEDQWVVVDSQDSRLGRGAVVRTLDGLPVDDFVREAARYVAASNERLARTHVFSYPGLFREKVSVGLESGAVVVVDRAAAADTRLGPFPQASEGRWLREGRIAYLRIPSFGNPAFERSAIDLVHQFGSSPSLVIDVRGNGGGATPFQLMTALMNRPRRWWQEAPVSRNLLPEPPSSAAYSGRLFLLVDRFCGSACEDFVMPFKDTARAVIVGETTQGSSGNPYRASLGYGMAVSIGAVRYRFPDGTPFEGVGIAPDVVVERRISDLVAGRDAILERAQALADAQR